MVQIVDAYANWLSTSPIPKLFINGDPAGFLIGAQREFCRTWPNQQEVTVKGAHFLPEDSPVEVADAIARFVAKVLARQALIGAGSGAGVKNKLSLSSSRHDASEGDWF